MPHDDSCRTYLAPSTIPGAGLGMFAGVDMEEGTVVTEGDIVVPTIDLEWHNGYRGLQYWLWDDYTWHSNSFTHMNTESTEHVNGASFGIGAIPNCLLSLVNIDISDVQYNNAGLHRSRDAGVGAFTTYWNRTGIASTNIESGAELFVWYGETYFESRTHKYGMIPLLQDYELADKILQNFHRLVLPDKLKEILWNFIRTKTGGPSRTINALPLHRKDIPKALEVGTSKLMYNSTLRSIEWLQQHGKCMDNLIMKNSTLRQAGRGAFASKFLEKGSVVAPLPLIHILNKSSLDIYNETLSEQRDAVVHAQLLLNYCLSHSQSSLLLCPYGVLTGLVNHSQEPNVKLEWAHDFMMHSEWLNFSVSELERHAKSAGLVMEFVATRDVHQGEEILLDYGPEWQQAWDAHVTHWKAEAGSKHYQLASELDSVQNLWPYNQSPYYNAQVWCRGYYFEPHDQDWVRCRILMILANNNYMVEQISIKDNQEDKCMEHVEAVSLLPIPRDAIGFEDEPYSRDHHLDTSFRHPIMIPNDLFPIAWRNLQE